jgi:hypothetical protein
VFLKINNLRFLVLDANLVVVAANARKSQNMIEL